MQQFLSGLLFKPADDTATAAEKTSVTTLTSRLTSPGSRIVIRTAEDKQLYLSRDDVHLMKALHRMADDLKVDESGAMTVNVPIALSAEELDKIVLWCRRKDQLNDAQLMETIFSPANVSQLIKFIEIAQFLDIDQLAEMLSVSVASTLEMMDVNDMRKALGREGKPPCTAEQQADLAELKNILKIPGKAEKKTNV